jgi:sphingolipid delta-4 desaturase
LDADLPNKAEARLINNYFIGKIVWLLFYPFFQTLRTSRLKEIAFMDGWGALPTLVLEYCI